MQRYNRCSAKHYCEKNKEVQNAPGLNSNEVDRAVWPDTSNGRTERREEEVRREVWGHELPAFSPLFYPPSAQIPCLMDSQCLDVRHTADDWIWGGHHSVNPSIKDVSQTKQGWIHPTLSQLLSGQLAWGPWRLRDAPSILVGRFLVVIMPSYGFLLRTIGTSRARIAHAKVGSSKWVWRILSFYKSMWAVRFYIHSY